MSRKSRNRKASAVNEGAPVKSGDGGLRLPRGGVDRLNVGQSFAEYDPALEDETTYVQTPAYGAASDPGRGKYFFVGRRGTGKTALRRFCAQYSAHALSIVPEVFSPASDFLDMDLFSGSSKRPFRSLVSAFRRALQDEVLVMWRAEHSGYVNLPTNIEQELAQYGAVDFDTRVVQLIAGISRPLKSGDETAWLAENKVARTISDEMKELGGTANGYTLLIDSIDDFWEGTPQGLVYLTAFMHACLEMSTQIPWARALLFLRENIFERVRAADSESSRLETAVVGMDWTNERLLEMVERRLNRPFNTKFALGGQTWNAWFEHPDRARSEVFNYCQRRPRDILIYVSHAIESAQAHRHDQILLDDIHGARRRFSDNRFKDLGDEYAENYPQIGLALSRFYGLGRTYTLGGIESFIRKLLRDREVTQACKDWIFEQAASVELFVRLLYNVGFVGINRVGEPARFRSLGPSDTSPPAVSDDVDIVVHRCYWDALDLQDVLVRSLPEDTDFGKIGIIEDLPGGMDSVTYNSQLDDLQEQLRALPTGPTEAEEFETLVGEVIRLCFFRALENVEHRVRDVDGRIVRDWIASNRAQTGFWERMRSRYGATQVIWECKNYADLKADDFHQASYYFSESAGRLVMLVCRGHDLTNTYFQHIRRAHSENRGLIFPLTDRDLRTFVRQARAGKVKEDHIQDRYDAIIRKLG